MKKIVIHPQVEATITELLQYLNQLSGRSIVVEGERAEKSRNMVRRLLARNYTAQEVREVIQCKCFEWGKNEKMFEYLHPSTLFSGNFQKYLDLVTDLKSNPEKADLFKKKVNGKQFSNKQPETLIAPDVKRNVMESLHREGFFNS